MTRPLACAHQYRHVARGHTRPFERDSHDGIALCGLVCWVWCTVVFRKSLWRKNWLRLGSRWENLPALQTWPQRWVQLPCWLCPSLTYLLTPPSLPPAAVSSFNQLPFWCYPSLIHSLTPPLPLPSPSLPTSSPSLPPFLPSLSLPHSLLPSLAHPKNRLPTH